MKKIIEPSLLSFDLKNIQNDINEIKQAGMNQIHYDVMDNKFVPNTAFDIEYLNLLNENNVSITVHFMVNEPIEWIKRFIKYKGIKAITFHAEPVQNLQTLELFELIRKNKIMVGIAIRPTTDPNEYIEVIKQSDIITVLGVQPGFGGQKFMPITIDNLVKIKKIKDELNPNLIIQLDGGVNFDVITQTYKYVDYFVSGSFLMKYEGNKKDIVDFLNKQA